MELFRSSGTVFGSKSWILLTKMHGFPDFFDILPTLKHRNFFSTRPILKIVDVLKSYESNSFISVIFRYTELDQGTLRCSPLERIFEKMHSPPYLDIREDYSVIHEDWLPTLDSRRGGAEGELILVHED